MTGVEGGFQRGWHLARGLGVQVRGRASVQSGMGTLVVVLVSETVEEALLGSEIQSRGVDGFLLESSMHTLVSSVLLRPARHYAMQTNTELEPPDRETTETTQRGGGERHSVVREDGGGEPVFGETAFKCLFVGSAEMWSSP
jgi:hypothetical protein